MNELLQMSIRQVHEALARKRVSAREVADAHLAQIERQDKSLNAFITPTPELARAQAAAVDEKIAKGMDIPLLAGIPCSLKDAILVEGVKCTAGSSILENYIAPYDATVTRKLREHDAVIVGKTNMDEFGMGGSTENSAFGPTRNPHDSTRVAGGSSGGGAASVASSEAMAGLGEDTGGSIRLPASFCGVVGLKPTYGAVSRHGIISLASSLDQVGPFAKTIEDCRIVFEAIRGKDPLDSTSVESEISNFQFPSLREVSRRETISKQIQDSSKENTFPTEQAKFKIQNLRIGVPKEYFEEGLDPKVEQIVKNALNKLESAGARIVEVSLPRTKYALAAYYLINTSEASANLARYDGIRYGVSALHGRAPTVHSLLDVYLQSRGKGLGPEVKRRIMLGTYALSAGYYDAYYVKAQRVRALLQQDFEQAFQKADVLAGPVSPFLPFKIGEKVENPLSMYLVDIYTVPVNLVGLPALSLPAGMSDNLPVGLHMIGEPFGEDLLFETGNALEKMIY